MRPGAIGCYRLNASNCVVRFEPMSETLFISDGDLAAAASWEDLIAAIRAAYTIPVEKQAVPPRTMARANGSWLRSLSAMPASCDFMGVKLIAASPRNRRASYLIALFDRASTELIALIDGNRVTATRTAATSALAVDAIAPARALRVAVVGSGLEARNHVHALAAVREIASLAIFSPTEANRVRLAAELTSSLGVSASAVATPEEALSDAELVVAAARSRDETPTVHGSWLVPGATVTSIGSTLPEQHEIDVEVVRRASRIFADVRDEVANETGDMLDAGNAGVEFESKLFSLEDLVRGLVPARNDPDEIVLYKSVGSALQDIAVAELYYRRIRERGGGTPLPATIAPVSK